MWRDPRTIALHSHLTFVRRTISCLVIILFVTLVALPTADRFLDLCSKTMVAETDTTPLPRLTSDPETWIKWFNILRRGYLERHYNLRGLLITWNSFMDTFVLASTTPSSKVMAGKEHWLFLAQDGTARNVIEDARSLDGLPEESLSLLATELERRRAWLSARGIRYLVFLTPNKNSVYPEKLPEALRPLRAESHMTQFVTYVRDHTKVDIVDTTPGLVEEKRHNQVFYITDSHWNAHGAFAAYRQILKPLVRDFPAIVPLDRSQFLVEQYKWLPGDLAYMMGLSDHLKEDRIQYFNKDWYKARGASYDGPIDPHYFETPQISVTGNDRLPNAVVFHDSFWWEMLPFVAESFNKALYVWLKPQTEFELRFFDTALIEREKPDIVIEEYTERYILPSLHGRFKIKNPVTAVKE